MRYNSIIIAESYNVKGASSVSKIPIHLTDDVYEQGLIQEIQARLPEKIFDAHVHLGKDRSKWHTPGYEGWHTFCDWLTGENRTVGGLLMPNPSPDEILVRENDFVYSTLANDTESVCGMLVSPGFTREETESYILSHSRIGGLKPYMNHNTSRDRVNLDAYISDFVPEYVWELADKYHLPVTLHIARYKGGLNDPDTLQTVQRVCREYPNMKLILAHCALAHNPDTLKAALPKVRYLDNLYFDTSGITESDAFQYVLDGFGPKRLIYGSDYDFGFTPGRLVQSGSMFIGLDTDYFNIDSIPRDYWCSFPCNALESLRALYIAFDKLGIDRAGQEDIFLNNSLRVFKDKAHEPSALPDYVGSARVMYGGRECIDISSDMLTRSPLGYGDLRVLKAIRGGLETGIPVGMECAEAESVRGELLAANPGSVEVVLTRGRYDAEQFAANAGGAIKIYGEELANGYAIGAVVLDAAQSERAKDIPRPPLPGCGECRAALAVLEALASEEYNICIAEIKRQAAALYKQYGISVEENGNLLKLGFADEETRGRYLKVMADCDIVAGDVFIPTPAHTPQVLEHIRAALEKNFAEVSPC